MASLDFPDIDECNDPQSCDVTTSTCINKDGGYTCTCRTGYRSVTDLECTGKCNLVIILHGFAEHSYRIGLHTIYVSRRGKRDLKSENEN